MNKKTVAIISVLILAVLVGGFWYAKQQKDIVIKNEKSNSVENIKEEIDTSNWQTYRNDEYGFEIKYPSNLVFTFQNKFDYNMANVLLYDNKFSDVAKSSDPLLAIMSKDTDYIIFNINGNSFVKDPGFDIKNFLTAGLSGPGGEIYATQKIVEWTSTKAMDNKTDLYFYIIDSINIETNKLIGQSRGVAWIANDAIFLLEPKGDMQRIDDLYKNMALSFSQK